MKFQFLIAAALCATTSIASAESYDHCYGRNYSIEHLKSNPSQDVTSLLVYVGNDQQFTDQHYMAVQAVVARNSLSIKNNTAGEVFESRAECKTADRVDFGEDILLKKSLLVCGVECDGGIGYVTEINDKQMTFVSRGMRMDYRQSGDGGCGGELDPVDLGFLDGKPSPDSRIETRPITYVLYRMDNKACDELKKSFSD